MSTRGNVATTKIVKHLVPASYTTTQTPADTTGGVDTKGYESVAFDIHVGAVAELATSPLGNGTWTFKAQEADTDANGSYADIKDTARILPGTGVSAVNTTTGVFLTLNTAAHQNAVYQVGVLSAKRFVRIITTAVDAPGASLLAITARLGKPSLA